MKRKTNEDNLRAARARLRAARTLLRQAATLLRQSVGLESMSDTTRLLATDTARRCDSYAVEAEIEAGRVTSRIAEAEAHLAAKVAGRKRASSP